MKPTLFVLAAGMGSRYGGLKQLDTLGPNGETIMDYSIYDAIQAGFGKVVFVIRHDFEEDFKNIVLAKYEGHIPVEVVFQDINSLPDGFTAPADRQKPWGTGHAVLMGKNVINEPFVVINADDFYGRDAYNVIARELSKPHGKGDYCMVAFRVGNTVTENGSVSRGVCSTKEGKLTTVVERTAITVDSEGKIGFNDENGNRQELDFNTPVSMNFWGFTPDYFDYTEREFRLFLEQKIDVPKSEFYIPSVVDTLIKEGTATVEVLDTDSRWFGVTYAEDRQVVVDKLADLHRQGIYPSPLFKK